MDRRRFLSTTGTAFGLGALLALTPGLLTRTARSAKPGNARAHGSTARRHYIVLGTTGYGKSTAIVVPNRLR